MILRLAACAALAVFAGLAAAPAAACPADGARTAAMPLSTRQLATPRAAAVRAGGTVVLEACADTPGRGHIPFEPTTVIHYTTDLDGRALEFRTEGACTPVILVRTARGGWAFGQGADGTARVVLGNPRAGRYAVWVGTTDAFGCDARLVVRAARPTRAGLRTAIR
jgi:hypothetical protein